MCRGSRTWIDKWGEVKPKYDPWRTEEEVLESGVIEETEAQISLGKILYEEKMKKSKEDEKIQKILKVSDKKSISPIKSKVFYKINDDHVAFYAPYGDDICVGATDWCKKHCYLKSKPFNKVIEKRIQDTKIEEINKYILSTLIEKLNAKYFTLFSSGSIESFAKNDEVLNLGGFLEEVISEGVKNTDKKVRIFMRTLNETTDRFLNDNTILILSIDISSYEKLLKDAVNSKSIKGIAVVNHEDNQELIDLVSSKYFLLMNGFKLINCEDCGDKMLCFNQKERFVLIQKFKN